MFRRKVNMQTYWTLFFSAALLIGVLAVIFILKWTVERQTMQDRLAVMNAVSHNIADDLVVGNADAIPQQLDDIPFQNAAGQFVTLQRTPTIYIADVQGRVHRWNQGGFEGSVQLIDEMTQHPAGHFKWEKGQEPLQIIKTPIETFRGVIGFVYVIETDAILREASIPYRQALLPLGVLGIIGLGMIYWLTKRLTVPIHQLAAAAREVEAGDYGKEVSVDVREAEVASLIQSFNAMTRQLQTLEQVRTDLLAGVTHELRTPITSVKGLIQAVRDGVVDEEQQAYFLSLASDEIDQLQQLVNDLLAFNQFAVGGLPIDRQTVAVETFIERTLDRWIQKYPQVNFHVEVEAADIQTDPTRLQQIITNCIKNGVEAMDEQGSFTLKGRVTPDFYVFEMTDTGKGIKEDEQGLIFEKFYRSEDKKYDTEGFGLGLTLSDLLAQSLGGTLSLKESRKGKTTFCLQLPIL